MEPPMEEPHVPVMVYVVVLAVIGFVFLGWCYGIYMVVREVYKWWRY
jgi:hypothetical protein